MLTFTQSYNPLHSAVLSTALAALPIVTLFYLLAVRRTPAPLAGLAAAGMAIAAAVLACGMPARLALLAFANGAAFGLLPIGWLVFSAMLFFNLTVETGQFELVKQSVANLTADRRLQALLIAFSFGACLEGAAGFGTPVAICAALMVGLGFPPLTAAVLCLIGNTAPVAFGGIGIPILTLAKITDLPKEALSAVAGQQLSFVSLIIPLWLVRSMATTAETLEVWPAILVCGGSFAACQGLWSNFVGPELTDIIAGVGSMVVLVLFLRVWQPRRVWRYEADGEATRPETGASRAAVMRAWAPFAFLSIMVFTWGLPGVKSALDGAHLGPLHASSDIHVPWLDKAVSRTVPVVAQPTPEPAVFRLNLLSAAGTSILVAFLLSALWLRASRQAMGRTLRRTLWQMRYPIPTIMAVLGLGFVTRYSGMDATLGLAFTHTGPLYPFFAPLLGWLGVFLTGSDTSSNALFGSLQKITAHQLGLPPVLICTANSTGGVMGKMIDAQSITVATAATDTVGTEGDIFRRVVWQSVALAIIMGLIVMFQAYCWPGLVPPS
jgi:lactate permease